MTLLTLEESKVKFKGVHTITVCDARTDAAKRLSLLIEGNAAKRQSLLREAMQRERLKTSFLGRIKESLMKPMPDMGEALQELWEEYRFFVAILHKNFKVREQVVNNITTTVGRTVFARRLSGNTTYTGIVNYTALGTGTTAAALGDTQLQTESYRKALSSGTYSNNIAYLETFFSLTETSGTFEEYGMFIDGSGTADSGQLFNRFLQTITKSLTETLNVQSNVTMSDA